LWLSAAGSDCGSDDGTPELPPIDDTLLDMYDQAHEVGDEHCDAIAAELQWRGIEVPACKRQHRGGVEPLGQ